MDEVTSLEEFAEKYPDEYNAYIDDMAEMYNEVVDYPEDWDLMREVQYADN